MPTPRNYDTGGGGGPPSQRTRTRLDPTKAKKKPISDVIFYQAPSHATKLGLPPPQSYGFGATLDGLVGQMTSGTMTEMLSLQNDQLLESKFHMLVEQMAVSTMAEMMPFHSDQTLECKAHGLIEQLPANAMRETMSLLNEPIPTTEVEGLAGKWPANEPKPAFGDVADMAFSELVERRGGRTLKLKKLYFVDEERTTAVQTGTWAWPGQFDNKHEESIDKLPLNTFTCFGRLPTEIRVKIWKQARPGPRIVRLAWSKKAPEAPSWTDHPERYRNNYSRSPIPSMLHACTESRQVALGWYMLSLAPLTGNSRAHFDFSRDYLLFGCGCNSRYWDCNCRDMVGHTARLRISRVLYWVPATWDYQLRYVHLSFKHVKEILVFEPPTPLPAHLKKNPEIKFEHLRETKKPFQWQEQGKDLYETFLSQTFLPRPPFAPYTPFSLDETYDPENAEEEQEKWSGYSKKIARVELGTTLEIMKTYYGTTNISYRLR